MIFFIAISAIFWLGALLQPWLPWLNREVLEQEASIQSDVHDLKDVTVVIPARNEGAIITQTLQSLAKQGNGLKIILIDDRSEDNTAEAARRISGINLTILTGEPLPEGWAGKLWALEQGVRCVETPLTLLLDADICLEPGVIASLKQIHQKRGRSLVSVMAQLHMQSFWEKILLPAFILYFKNLYPFALANSNWRRFASASGGCIFLETRLFAEIGGLQSIRSALIDDCTLARQVKACGERTWTGLSRQIHCIRPYTGLSEIWNMVARSAYTQLGYSPVTLGLLTLIMGILFWMPVLGLFSSTTLVRNISLVAGIGMLAFHLPTILFYGLNPLLVLLIPLTGTLYLCMTWSSALRYYRGVRSQWKGRVYKNN
jgi:hopene-associated glycosyltransferase HpnB